MNASAVLISAINKAINKDGSLRALARNCGLSHHALSRITTGRSDSISDDNAKKLVPYLISKGFVDEDELRESLQPEIPRPRSRPALPNEVEPLKQWLHDYMEDHGMDITGLSEITNVAESTYRRWFRDDHPSLPQDGILKRLKKWRRDVELNTSPRPRPIPSRPATEDDLFVVSKDQLKAVPIIGLADAAGFDISMGSLADYLQECSTDTQLFTDVGPDDFCVWVRGDSLEPDIPHGSKMLVAGGSFPKRGCLVLAKLRDGTGAGVTPAPHCKQAALQIGAREIL